MSAALTLHADYVAVRHIRLNSLFPYPVTRHHRGLEVCSAVDHVQLGSLKVLLKTPCVRHYGLYKFGIFIITINFTRCHTVAATGRTIAVASGDMPVISELFNFVDDDFIQRVKTNSYGLIMSSSRIFLITQTLGASSAPSLMGVPRILEWKGFEGTNQEFSIRVAEPIGLRDEVPQKLKRNVKLVYNFL